MPPKIKKRTGVQLERMLLQPIPETPVPQPYFSIPSPDPYRFPLSQTLLEGVKLLQNYFPDDINQKIRKKLNCRIERMSRYKDTYCMLGKDGNGLLIGEKLMNVRGVSAFCYGSNYLILAYQDLSLEVYDLNLNLIKALKNFTPRKITFLKILNTPKTFQSIIILANSSNKVSIHRIQKSFFSTLSCKLSQDIIKNLDFPVTQMTQIPTVFKFYLRKDITYKDCSLVCISAINKIFILRINHFKLTMDKFWDVVYSKEGGQPTTNSVSWGQASVCVPSLEMKGDKLILTYSFGQQIYFVAFKQVQKYLDGQVVTKCQWIDSKAFTLKQGRVAFCQFMKKSQILIITQDNTVIIFHTKNFEIFQKQINSEQVQKLTEKCCQQHLQGRIVQNISGKKLDHPDSQKLTQEQSQMLGLVPLVTFADSFSYEYPSNQIYFLTQQKFGVYVYCNWKLIANILKVQQRYQCAMLFLIAMAKKANRFDLGLQGSQKQLSEYVQVLATDYINNKVSKIKVMPQILKQITTNDQFFKMVITPIQFLTETQEFEFLFDVAKDKIISALALSSDPQDLQHAENIFFQALNKFIQHGRIKYIPETQLQRILDYYINVDRLDMIDRLAIYFDLSKIDRNIVIQCLLQQNLVVSLAHICTQGNQSQFITPFVKFWGISENHRLHGELNFASTSAFRALWYVKLCLQRNWGLKQYSFDKYAQLITVLSQHFLTERILKGLISIRAQDCLDTLSYYFTIENATIINQIDLNLKRIPQLEWIQHKQGNQQLEIVLAAIAKFTGETQGQKWQTTFTLFLSGIIVYKTIKFKKQKYYNILIKLIQQYPAIKEVKFGLEDSRLEEYMEQNKEFPIEEIQCNLAARYIIRIFTLVYYQVRDYMHSRLNQLYQQSRLYNLTDLQADIAFIMGNFRTAIDIYARAKPSGKRLVFEFLENAFKKLVLQKRKQDKRLLAQCITAEIKWMVKLNPKKTKNLVDVYIPQIQQQLIAALGDDQALQLEYLEDIINDQGYNQRKKKLSDKTIIRFVQLMAKLKPDHLIQVFKKNPYLSIEQSLKVCQVYKVYDCMEYLYQRMGSIAQSVKIAALRIDQILQQRQQFQEYEVPYIKIKQILDNAIQVCRKSKSQQIWQALLDSSIALYQKYRQSNLPQDQIQIFFYINGQIMEHLASNCPLEHTIELLQNKYQNLNMGGKMTKAFINILSNLSHSINILYIVSNLVQGSLQNILAKDYQQKLQCYSTINMCQTCGYDLEKRKNSIHFMCGHAYHRQCVIDNDPIICVACLINKTDQFAYYINTSNPQHPKIKKINELFQKYNSKKLQMSQIFKIQQYQQINKKQQTIIKTGIQKKKNKFQIFDQNILQVQIGNRRVLRDLRY